MAFIDADEFLVLKDPDMAAMPQLLREYTQFGALAINWQVLFCHCTAQYSIQKFECLLWRPHDPCIQIHHCAQGQNSLHYRKSREA